MTLRTSFCLREVLILCKLLLVKESIEGFPSGQKRNPGNIGKDSASNEIRLNDYMRVLLNQSAILELLWGLKYHIPLLPLPSFLSFQTVLSHIFLCLVCSVCALIRKLWVVTVQMQSVIKEEGLLVYLCLCMVCTDVYLASHKLFAPFACQQR